MARVHPLLLLVAVLALAGVGCRGFEFHEATLDAIHLGFKNGSLTSTALVEFYLGQISRLNPLLGAVIEVNPDALRQAAQADAERLSSSGDGDDRSGGGLHGVPVLLKDNIGTRDRLNTTAGSLALLGSVVRRDAGVVARLRRAGAVVLGKANMDEWANFRSAVGTVADAVHVLDAIVGYDELDAVATRAGTKYIPEGGYTQFLKIDGLKGKRIGVPNGFFDFEDGTVRQMVYQQHLNTLRGNGAVVIENLDIANLDVIQNATVSGELAVLAAEFKIVLNAYLSDLSSSPVRSLAEIIAFNDAHPDEEMLKQFGQLIFLVSENTTGIGSVEKAAIKQLDDLTANGVEKVMKEHRLDAIVAPDSSSATVLAIAGLPGIAVPAGFDEQGAPFGITFGGLKGYEPRLIEIAYAFDQATKVRTPPMFKQ
ncbi:unnamed protein product [Urochloa decumbens]|uniref:Amidase domain-containing protein n=1 Tax=Urochloa decumbens TaxID=240449 RepID=A0ABC9D9B3_9POAL